MDPATVSPRVGPDVPTALVVRPEDIRLTGGPDDPARERVVPQDANGVDARVTDVEYMGAYRVVLVAMGASGVRGRVRLDPGTPVPAVGSTVQAWWSPARQRVVTQ